MRSSPDSWFAALNQLQPLRYVQNAFCAEHRLFSDAAAVHGSPVIAVNVRDEAHLAEWLVHHLLAGFGSAFVWDDASVTPRAPLVRVPRGLHGRVTMASICTGHPRQPKARLQQDAVNAAALLGASWAMALDADEFLVLQPLDMSVTSWLATFEDSVMQVAVNWLVYGSSYLEDLPAKDVMLAHYTMHAPGLDQHVKCLQRTADASSKAALKNWTAESPHFMTYLNKPVASSLVDGKRWDAQNFNRDGIREPRAVPAFVAHFMTQARLECVRRKILLPRDDDRTYRVNLKPTDSLSVWDPVCHHGYNEVNEPLLLQAHASRIASQLKLSQLQSQKRTPTV